MEKYTALDKLCSLERNGTFFMAKNTHDTSEVKINVGGTIFHVRNNLLCRIPSSKLSHLDKSSSNFDRSQQEFYFEQDPKLFEQILNVYREGELHMPKMECPMRFRKAMAFWKIPVQLVAPCCWKDFYSVDNDLNTLNILVKSTNTLQHKLNQVMINNNTHLTDSPMKKGQMRTSPDRYNKEEFRHKLWLFLDDPTTSSAAKAWCFFYIFLVLVSTVIVMIWNEPAFRVDPYISTHFYDQMKERNMLAAELNITLQAPFGSKVIRLMTTDPHPVIYIIDSVCMFVFITECMLHFMVCQQKIKLIKDPYHWFKVGLSVAILVSTILEIKKDVIINKDLAIMYISIKSVNILRLLLIFRLRKFYKGFELMLLSLARSSKEFGLLLIAFTICIIIYGGLIYCVEINNNTFSNAIYTMWWALITMTTVGYGDYYPTGYLGYIVGGLCAINGLIVLALPVAAIAQNFSEIYSRNGDLEKHLDAIEEMKQKDEHGSQSEILVDVDEEESKPSQ